MPEIFQSNDSYDRWLDLKVKEFKEQGYSNISSDDLYHYFRSYKWRQKEPKHYAEIVSDIMSLTPNDYFNYANLQATAFDVKTLDEMNLDDLF